MSKERDKDWEEERHEIFKKDVYPLAVLPRNEFKFHFEVWKKQNPDLWDDKTFRIDFSPYQLRKFIRNYKW